MLILTQLYKQEISPNACFPLEMLSQANSVVILDGMQCRCEGHYDNYLKLYKHIWSPNAANDEFASNGRFILEVYAFTFEIAFWHMYIHYTLTVDFQAARYKRQTEKLLVLGSQPCNCWPIIVSVPLSPLPVSPDSRADLDETFFCGKFFRYTLRT